MHNDVPHIGVVGGGIGGTALALFLSRAGIPVTVFERAGEHREIGAGVQVSPNATRLLSRAGLLPALAEVSAIPEVIWQFHQWRTGEVLFEQKISEQHRRDWGSPFYLIRRSKLLEILCETLPPGTIRLDARIVEVQPSPNGRAVVTLADQERFEFDAVIAADGFLSRVRSSVFGYADPKYSGYFAFRATASMADVPLPERPATTSIWLGPDRHFVHYPIERNEVLNLVCAVPAPTWDYAGTSADGSVEEFRQSFADWHPLVDQLISACHQPRKFALHYSDEFPTWTKDNVALLGDAAHPMLSFFAQGSCQAMEDAAVLAQCLQNTSTEGVTGALQEYEAVRKPRASAVQANANARLHGYHIPDGPEQEKRDDGLRTSDPMSANGWVYAHDVQRELTEYRTARHDG